MCDLSLISSITRTHIGGSLDDIQSDERYQEETPTFIKVSIDLGRKFGIMLVKVLGPSEKVESEILEF